LKRSPGAAALLLALVCAPPASADILVADSDAFGGGGGVIRVDSLTGARTTLSENASPPGGPSFVDPLAVALAPNGDILVADQQAFGDAGGGVIRVDPLTGARTTVSENASPPGGPSFVDPFGIAVAANGDILIADQNAFGPGNGAVIRVDPVTGVRTLVSENGSPTGPPLFDAPFGITTAASGDILVTDAGAFGGGGGVIRVNPVTGARTTLSENASPTGGPSFSDPFGIAREASGSLLVADGGIDGIIRVDPVTGARTLVSDNSNPPGGAGFSSVIGVAIAANGDILVADSGVPGVLGVNPVSGARTVVSSNASPAGGPAFALPFGIAVRPDPAPPAGPAGLPPPVLGVSVNVHVTRGTVRVSVPAGGSGARAAQKGVRFERLTEDRQIPVGSFLDTKKGRVRLTSAVDAAGTLQTGEFFKGVFQVVQKRSGKDRGLTELRLKGSSFKRCKARRRGRGKRASAAARKRLSGRTVRRLQGDANGRFRTRGRHSAATVRGTVWSMADRCDGTLTRVLRGRVAVRDFRRKKTINLRAGKSYLARAQR
jgi:hypothetical protein